MNELARKDDQSLARMAVTPEQLEVVRNTIAAGATPAELQLFCYDCKRQGVHPLDRLLHFTKRGGKYTPVTSIDLFRARAADTGAHAGTSDAVFGPPDAAGHPEYAHVSVKKIMHGKIVEFAATARWVEYYPGDAGGHMWKKMPHLMLSKCAEALALRKAFPRELAGVHVAEELEQERPEPPPIQQPRRKSATPRGPTPPLANNQATSGPTLDKQTGAPAGGAVTTENVPPQEDPLIQEDATTTEVPNMQGGPEHVYDDCETAHGTLEKVNTKVCTNGATRFGVLVDGAYYNTFDKKVGEYAKTLKATYVEVTFKRDGDFKNLVRIAPVTKEG